MKKYIFIYLAIIGFANISYAKTLLPLGDGKLSSEPKTGYIYSCSSAKGSEGAFKDSPWILGDVWDLDAKPTVQGEVYWPNSKIDISINNSQRVITANDLPNHATGIYPIQRTDPAYSYDRNPNSISEQNILLTLPQNPTIAETSTCVGMGMIGFALSGVAIFNAFDAQQRDAPAHEIQDECSGHPAPNSMYHYHSSSKCIKDMSGDAGNHSDLAGYMLDGFGIYGMKGEGGVVLTNADLDECHGHTHEVLWDGNKVNMYHYHFTKEYPYSIGCFKGTPIQMPRGGGVRNGGGRMGPPQGEMPPDGMGQGGRPPFDRPRPPPFR